MATIEYRGDTVSLTVEELVDEIVRRGYRLTLVGPQFWSNRKRFRYEVTVVHRDGVTTGKTHYGETAREALEAAIAWIRKQKGTTP